MWHKRNLIIVSLVLFLAFALAISLIGKKIEATANDMHQTMIQEIGKYRAELIALDFRKTVELANTAREYLELKSFEDPELQELLTGLVHFDRKVSRIWYKNKEQHFVCVDSAGIVPQDAVSELTLEKLTQGLEGKQKSGLYYSDGILYWTLYGQYGDKILGIDVSLSALHAYFASMSPDVRSYAYVLNGEGVFIVHPDENKIGRRQGERGRNKYFQQSIQNNKSTQHQAFSDYLSLSVERVYYPIPVGKERWVVVINVPDLVLEEQMAGFQWYTLQIVLFTLLVFGILLVFSQYKWRKEYDRRRKLEQEALELNLRQLKNQVNPHFLFNSLNSLGALIDDQPALAREFVLRLSKIYRYVLEKRNESLVSAKEEVGFIRHYYFLQRIRFGEQLHLEIAEQLTGEERKIPAMSLQMLIENAIKHNEITRQHPLVIRIYEEGNKVVVENTCTLRTDATEDSFGIGFENISRIYAYCSDQQFTYRMEGDKFRCVLPLIE